MSFPGGMAELCQSASLLGRGTGCVGDFVDRRHAALSQTSLPGESQR